MFGGSGATIGQKGVKYGLQVRKAPGAKPAAAPAKKRSVFGDEDSDDDAQDNVEQQIARQAARKQTDKKVADLHAAALAEDAAVFDYDSHYDSIQEARAEPKKEEKLQRQSRYIAGLLGKAEERKQEQEVFLERQIAKERAAEDHLFGDKERFVTAAYRAKLAERQAWQEEQKRKKEAEESDTVEKRGHMGDFYRNLLRSNVAFGGKPAEPAAGKQPGPEAPGAGTAGQARAGEEGQAKEEEEEEPQWLSREQSPPPAAAAGAPAQQQQQRQGGEEQPPAARQEAAAEAAAAQQPGDAAGKGSGAASTGDQEAAAAAAAAAAGQRRNQEDAVAAARARYLARKRQKTSG